MQIEAMFIKYITSQRATVRLKQTTISTYWRQFESYIKPFFLAREIINEREITAFTSFLLFKVSRKTTNDILTLLSTVLKYNKIPVEIYKPRFTVPKIESLTDAEWERLEDYCLSHLNYLTYGILISLYTGVRPGELSACRKKDLNLIECELAITHTLQRIKNLDPNAKSRTQIIIDTPKSAKAVRNIPLIDDLVTIGTNLYKDIPPNAFLLTGNEKYIEVRLLETRINSIYAFLGIKGKNLYTLRHTFATRFYNATNDIKTLSELLGHASIQTTYRYIFTSDEQKRQGVNSLVSNRALKT
mgnify:CR=1 FL=1